MITLESKKKEAEEKASELTNKLGVKVYPFVFAVADNAEDFVVGFFKEPSRQIKTMYLDKMGSLGLGSASSQLLEACLLTDESDKRVVNEDVHWFGACGAISGVVQASQDQFKKK